MGLNYLILNASFNSGQSLSLRINCLPFRYLKIRVAFLHGCLSEHLQLLLTYVRSDGPIWPKSTDIVSPGFIILVAAAMPF